MQRGVPQTVRVEVLRWETAAPSAELWSLGLVLEQ